MTEALPADTVNAFIVGPAVLAKGAPHGPLAGLTLAVKDLFDVAGYRTGAGNPDWLSDGAPATETASAVRQLVDAGATLVGKTHTDELAYSIAGTNVHYGMPANANAPGHVPGGSSSGSAAAVAAGLVDIALGTDTGGSIRVPASYCGVFGFRPSWGRVAAHGLLPLALSYDTVGLFARDAQILERAATALLSGPSNSGGVTSMVMAADAWALADADVAQALGEAVRSTGLAMERVDLAGEMGGLEAWVRTFRTIQGAEAWAAWGPWIRSRKPHLGPGVAARFAAGSRVTPADLDAARALRPRITERVRSVLQGGKVLIIPSACGPAPTPERARTDRDDIRERTLRLTCIAGNAGAPVVSVPAATVNDLPVGLSLIGAPGTDESVLRLASTRWGPRSARTSVSTTP